MLMAYSYILYGLFVPFMALSMYTRTNNPLHINTGVKIIVWLGGLRV